MLITSYITKKIPGFIALLLFATIMSGVLMFFSSADLSSPVGNMAGTFFNLLTQSAGNPGFLLTIVILSLTPLVLKASKTEFIRLLAQFAVLLVFCFITKTVLKQVTEIPRPYSYQLQSLGIIHSTDDFYQLSDDEREHVVKFASPQISKWRTSHWQEETNYSFPSGHTIFAAACVVFWGGFFLSRRRYLPTALLIAWATSVGISRIWLGMHWPTDLLASIVCAGLIYCCVPESLPYPQKQTVH